MDTGALFMIFSVLIMVTLMVSQPFLERTPGRSKPADASDDEREHRRSSLLAEHERVLSALQELDFDQALGKVPAEDYASTRSNLLADGAAVLRQLDEFEGPGSAGSVEDRMEAAVAARRADLAQATTASAPNGRRAPLQFGDDDLEKLIAARKKERLEKVAGFCPRCGQPVQSSDRFCPRCGAKIDENVMEHR